MKALRANRTFHPERAGVSPFHQWIEENGCTLIAISERDLGALDYDLKRYGLEFVVVEFDEEEPEPYGLDCERAVVYQIRKRRLIDRLNYRIDNHILCRLYRYHIRGLARRLWWQVLRWAISPHTIRVDRSRSDEA